MITASAYVGFGANLGDRENTFREAVEALKALPSIEVTACSSLFETVPVGLSDKGPSFINAAIALNTSAGAEVLMGELERIEGNLGKTSEHRSDLSRAIDLDLLMYGDHCLDTGHLKIPHPRMHLRAFVLVPLNEIAPHAVHPVIGRTVNSLFGDLSPEDLEGVKLFSDDR